MFQLLNPFSLAGSTLHSMHCKVYTMHCTCKCKCTCILYTHTTTWKLYTYTKCYTFISSHWKHPRFTLENEPWSTLFDTTKVMSKYSSKWNTVRIQTGLWIHGRIYPFAFGNSLGNSLRQKAILNLISLVSSLCVYNI